MSLPAILPRCAVTACLITIVATAAGMPTSASGDSGCVTVTGGSVQTVRITVAQPVEDVRPLASSGEPGPFGCLVSFAPSSGDVDAGSCHALCASIAVSSNVHYDVLVSGQATVSGLRFLSGMPSSYAECTGGEPVSDAMFPAADPPGGWVLRQPRTGRRVHPFWVSVVAGPGEDPLERLAGSRLALLVWTSE